MGTVIAPNHEYLVYRGRYDDTDMLAPVFGYPYSGVKITFEGPELLIRLKNKHYSMDNYIGVIIDDEQKKFKLTNDDGEQDIRIACGLNEIHHEAFVFKRNDLCNEIVFLGFDLGERGKILMPKREPRRLIEFIGDSITVGECVESKKGSRGEIEDEEAAATTNPYYSYAAMVARMMHTRVSLVAQSGIAMQDGRGLFGRENKVGMESLYRMSSYNQIYKTGTEWNYERDIPNAIIISLGQFDAHPENIVSISGKEEELKAWKDSFTKLLCDLRKKYPKTYIILTTSICRHSPKWDRIIGQICVEIGDSRMIHYLYDENGRKSNGFVNIAQSEQMAIELNRVLKSLENQGYF